MILPYMNTMSICFERPLYTHEHPYIHLNVGLYHHGDNMQVLFTNVVGGIWQRSTNI